jgi:HD-GYP domain-containing protein (c-di-GMP phosphodiesterase class II)
MRALDEQVSKITVNDQADRDQLANRRLREIEDLFEARFSLLRAATGDIVKQADDAPPGDWMIRGELCRQVASQGRAELIEDEPPFVALAIPVFVKTQAEYVAIAGFVTEELSEANISPLASALAASEDTAAAWAQGRIVRSADQLTNLATLLVQRDAAVGRSEQLQQHVQSLSDNLSTTYEEISLLHRLTANLRIREGANTLAEMTLEWLGEIIPAHGLAAYLNVWGNPEDAVPDDTQAPMLITTGECPVSESTFAEMVDELGETARRQPVVMNRTVTDHEPWQFSAIRELLLVPLASGDKNFGYLAAFNHSDDGEFGTVEASLLSSIANILGIHSGNIEMYREQVKLLSGMLHALVSAIDAKDPYTCGHSNRVARVSLRLAEQLECSDELKNTIYLSGILHDIGKIGISDQVLGKPGRLTDEEYEHIKQHPELGYNILRDIKRIRDVLPGVLHHHENWDGTGYPHRLAGEDIPYMARIIAVADAFDAMGSDRPYRKGMPDEKVDSILRDGVGSQWDAQVIDAFFAARDDIREIAKREREHVELNMQQWA